MKARIVIMIFLVAFVIGCKTTKVSTKIDREVQTEEKRDVKEKTDSKAAVVVNEVVETQNDVAENTVVTEIVRELSKPDTLGKQYTTKVIERTTTRDKNDNSRTNKVRDSSSNTDMKTELADNTDLNTDSSEQTDIKEKTKVKTPGIFNWLFILLVLGALVFGYFILRRYKLIK